MEQEFNYHSHTKRCHHAVGEDEEYVVAAIKHGYRYMGFSDHAPFNGGDSLPDRMRKDQLEEYIASVKGLQRKYQDQIDIVIGLEFEFYEQQLEELLEYKEKMDYLILGQHGPAMFEEEFYDRSSDQDILLYASLIEKACALHLPDIIAHPDLFMFSKTEWTPACIEASHRIAKAARDARIPLEINLNGVKYGVRQLGEELRITYPYRKFWEIVSTYDVDVIYGLDAHTPMKYGDKESFAIVKEIVADLPLKMKKELKFEKNL